MNSKTDFINVVTRPIQKDLIKEREAGRGVKLSYISGETVIRLLNEAFDYLWNWEITNQWVQESISKFNPKYDKEPQSQAPVAHVSGRLTVFIKENDQTFSIIKEASGSKSIVGGQSEQESIFKAAGTDALKKAATLLGIGLDLYEDKQGSSKPNYNNKPTYQDVKVSPTGFEGKETELQKLKELKAILGIEDNTQLNPYVKEFNGSSDYKVAITPNNIEAFNKFLTKKAENI